MVEADNKTWPFLIYDQWAAALRSKLKSAGLEVDLLDCLRYPLYDALLEGDHRGILFGQEGRDPEPETTEAAFQDWLGRLRPECPFDLDLLAERVAMARLHPGMRNFWEDYEVRISESRQHPIKHPAAIEAILAESRGFVFYRDQPARILAVVLGVQLHEVDLIVKGQTEPEEAARKEQAFVARLVASDTNEGDASELWQMSVARYWHTKSRPLLDARRAQILWCLTVRRRHPRLFAPAWADFQKTFK